MTKHNPDLFLPKIKELAKAGLTPNAISQALKREFENAPTKMTISSWIKKYGIHTKSKADLDQERYQEILVLVNTGKGINEIREMGYSYDLIKRVARENGITLKGRSEAAEDRTLTKEEVLSRLPKDQNYQYLGREYGKYKIMAQDGTVFYKSATRLHQGQPRNYTGREMPADIFADKLKKAGYSLIEGSLEDRNGPGTIQCINGHTRKLKSIRSAVYNKFNGCDECTGSVEYSVQELDFLNFVKSLCPDAQKHSLSRRLGEASRGTMPSIDVYIPSKKIGFEYCGVYWHALKEQDCAEPEDGGEIENFNLIDSSTGSKRTNPKIRKFQKREVASKEGIKLFHIYSSEWIHQKDLIKSMVCARLGLIRNKVMARKCEIRQIDQKVAHDFLSENHIMGPKYGSKNLGLFHGNELVCVMTYSKKKISSGRDGREASGVEIDRFATKKYTSVAGSFSKLLSHIIKEVSPDFIFSYVDLRHGDGHSLLQNGFKLEKISLGFMWSDGNRTHGRLKCRANMDERGLSEAEYAEELGWNKIFDAGQAAFVKWLK